MGNYTIIGFSLEHSCFLFVRSCCLRTMPRRRSVTATSKMRASMNFRIVNPRNLFMKVTVMLTGEIVNEMRYSRQIVAQLLYILFAFLVVILLSNVLIAIVTDLYGVIRNERTAMVFWLNCLDFVAEMDAIKNVGKIIMRCFRLSEGTENYSS